MVRVTILDVNDNTPVCDSSRFSFSTAEANPLAEELGRVTATDGDNVAGLPPVGSGQLNYQIVSPMIQAIFSISPTVSEDLCMQ